MAELEYKTIADKWGTAACKDMDTNIFLSRLRRNVTLAKETCNKCELKQECLEYALSFEGRQAYGIFGGLQPNERIKLRRARLKQK